MNRRQFVINSAALATTNILPHTASQSEPTAPRKRPNILVFMPDQQQGATVLPSHPCITPNLDRFTAQGLTFSKAFCSAPHCCPSRASFMTGLYPSEHGVFNNVSNEAAIHPDPYPGTTYFSQPMKASGYRMGYVGKWHVGRTVKPEDAGFESLLPGKGEQKYAPKVDMNSPELKRAKRDLSDNTPRKRGEMLRPGWGNRQMYATLPDRGPKGYEGLEDAEIVLKGAEAIRQYAKEGEPWCLMVSNSGGHDLYNAPKKFVDMYDPKKIELPPNFRDVMGDKPHIYQRMRFEYFMQLSDDEVRECIAHYWAKLTMQDALFGELLKALEESGQADDTLVIYTSDHGDYAGAHGLWAKGVPSFQEGYNIPCVVRWPNGIKQPGRQIDELVSVMDFAPTILEAAGVAPLKPMSGSALTPWFDGNTKSWRDTLLLQLNGVELYYTQRIVMTKKYKYVYNGFDFDELYDLEADPHEMRNLAYPDTAHAEELVRKGAGMQHNDDVPWPPLPPALGKVRADLLKKMWHMARAHNDQIFDAYVTTAMAPLGPAIDL